MKRFLLLQMFVLYSGQSVLSCSAYNDFIHVFNVVDYRVWVSTFTSGRSCAFYVVDNRASFSTNTIVRSV